MTLRERKKAATREALEQAAHMLARDVPWSEVSVDQIASTAGVSRRTFFNYFDSKDAVLSSASAVRPANMLAAVRARPDDETPWQALREGLSATLADATHASIAAFRGLWQEPSAVNNAVGMRSQLVAQLTTEVAARRPAWPVHHANLVVSVFIATARSAVSDWLERDESEQLLDVVDEYLVRVTIVEP